MPDHDFTAAEIGESIVNGNITLNLDYMGLGYEDDVQLATVDLFVKVVYAMADHDHISKNRDTAVAHALRTLHTHVRNRLR
jgi:hypothetical protein